MNDLGDLYQDVVLDHGRRPRNFHADEAASHRAQGYNPLCGDQITLYLKLDERGVVRDACFQGQGCAISTASASLMTQAVKGRTREEVHALFENLHHLVTGEGDVDGDALGKLAVFGGVRDYPNRVKCATLAWHTLNAALERADDPVTTE